MRFLLLLPLLIYVGLAFFNMNVLAQSAEVSIFGLYQMELPLVLFISLFFVIYLILMFLFFDSINALAHRKIRKLDKDVFELKSKLYDEREDELVVFMKEQRNKIENFLKEQKSLFEKMKTENTEHLIKVQSETNRIMDKLHLIDKSVLDKIKETFKAKN